MDEPQIRARLVLPFRPIARLIGRLVVRVVCSKSLQVRGLVKLPRLPLQRWKRILLLKARNVSLFRLRVDR